MSIRFLSGLFAATFAVLAAAPADAAFKVEISVNGGTAVTIQDELAGDSSSVVGKIVYEDEIIAGLKIVTDTATSNSGNPGSIARLQNSISVTNMTSDLVSLVIRVTDTGFNFPLSSAVYGLVSEITGPAEAITGPGNGNTAGVFQSHFDSANQEFGSSSTTGEQLIGLGMPTTSIFLDAATPYSLTQVFTYSVKANQDITVVGTTEVIAPEPTSLALLAIGGVGLAGGAIRRRRNAN